MKFSWWKLVVGFLLFIGHHQIYEVLGDTVLGKLLGEGIESVYPHMKMLFFAYLAISVIDFFIQRRKGTLGSSFLYARMLILAAAPWMMIAIFYIPDALGYHPTGLVEILWGIIMTLVGVYLCICREEPLDNMPLRGGTKAVIALAFVGTVITYAGFSFHVPDNFFYVDR
ncbi:MAG: hypothetical protein Kow002_05980 [Anaerolineales bacterium]